MSKYSISLLVFAELGLIYVGVTYNPLLMCAIPIGLFLFVLMINIPAIPLILLTLTGIYKGYLLSVFPIFIQIDITVLLFTVILLGILKYHFVNKLQLPKWARGIVIVYILICAYIAFSILFTSSPNYGITKGVSFILFGTLLFIVPLLTFKSEKDTSNALKLYIGFMAILTVGMIGQIIYHYFSGGFITYLIRVTLLGANPIPISRNLAIFAAMITVFIIRKNTSKKRQLLTVLFVVLLALISTGSRGAVISLVVGLSIYAIVFEPKYRMKMFSIGIIIAVIIAALLIILPESITSRYYQALEGEIVFTATGIKRISTIGTRLMFWEMSIDSFFSSVCNAIFGLGAGGFSSLFVWHDFKWYPHNIVFEVLVEFGLVGILLLFMFAYKVINILFKNISQNHLSYETSAWMIGLLVMAISSLFSGDIVNNRPIFFFLSMTMVSYKNNEHILLFK